MLGTQGATELRKTYRSPRDRGSAAAAEAGDREDVTRRGGNAPPSHPANVQPESRGLPIGSRQLPVR